MTIGDLIGNHRLATVVNNTGSQWRWQMEEAGPQIRLWNFENIRLNVDRTMPIEEGGRLNFGNHGVLNLFLKGDFIRFEDGSQRNL